MTFGWYILDDNNIPMQMEDDLAACTWLFNNQHRKRVAATTLADGVWVSTVFLGIDHSWGTGPPVLFETMVFSNETFNGIDTYTNRYCTYTDAMVGHRRVVDKLRKRLVTLGKLLTEVPEDEVQTPERAVCGCDGRTDDDNSQDQGGVS